MPGYSLNWTARSSAIQGRQKSQCSARPPEGSLTKARGLLASSLPWSINRPAQMSDSPLNSQQNWENPHFSCFERGQDLYLWASVLGRYKPSPLSTQQNRPISHAQAKSLLATRGIDLWTQIKQSSSLLIKILHFKWQVS